MAQINTVVGDFAGNVAKVCAALDQGRALGVDLVVFPEQTLPGYPAEDLLEREDFVEDCGVALRRVVEACRGVAAVVGTLTPATEGEGNRVYNSAVLIDDGHVIGSQHKTLLPTYDVFDEGRYFRAADDYEVFSFRGRRLGLSICEDLWNDARFWAERRYAADPAEELARRGADLMVAISASPFSLGRGRFRWEMLRALTARHGFDLVYCNLVGGNTTLVFDGASFAMRSEGDLIARAPAFEEGFVSFTLDAEAVRPPDAWTEGAPGGSTVSERWSDDDLEACYRALVLGVRDYLGKSGFERAVIGLSGGIDSALTAAVACDALGPSNVTGISLPSRYSSDGSLTDAEVLARTLGMGYHVVPIEGIFAASLETLSPLFEGLDADVTEENLQARIRGLLLMALSNKFNALLLTTGNKSELAVGYCTLYGDMSGGLAVISDVPKTLVYALSRWLNRNAERIPTSTIEKPPSAELRPDQKDEDSLPPYDVLDAILEAYIEEHRSARDIVAAGYDSATVDEVLRLVDRNEYKRKQAAPGIRVTGKAFGPGRRIPIVHRRTRSS